MADLVVHSLLVQSFRLLLYYIYIYIYHLQEGHSEGGYTSSFSSCSAPNPAPSLAQRKGWRGGRADERNIWNQKGIGHRNFDGDQPTRRGANRSNVVKHAFCRC